MENQKIEVSKIAGPVAKTARKVCELAFKVAQKDHEERMAAITLANMSLAEEEYAQKASEKRRADDKTAASVKLASVLDLTCAGDVTAALATSSDAAYKRSDMGTLEFCAAWANVLAPWIKVNGSKGDTAVKALATGLNGALKAKEKLEKNDRMTGLVFLCAEQTYADGKILESKK